MTPSVSQTMAWNGRIIGELRTEIELIESDDNQTEGTNPEFV